MGNSKSDTKQKQEQMHDEITPLYKALQPSQYNNRNGRQLDEKLVIATLDLISDYFLTLEIEIYNSYMRKNRKQNSLSNRFEDAWENLGNLAKAFLQAVYNSIGSTELYQTAYMKIEEHRASLLNLLYLVHPTYFEQLYNLSPETIDGKFPLNKITIHQKMAAS